MSAQFQRQTHNSSFVAYSAAPSKKPLPLAINGQAGTARLHADVFINEYTSVKIKEVTDNGDTIHVKIDASSVVTGSGKKLRHDFGASAHSNTDLHRLAVEAQATGRPVYLAMETRRRYKTKGGEIIPYTTPIHVLRGCQEGPQSKANSNMTGENCSKIIAAIGWADEPAMTLVSEEADSDPYAWNQVWANQHGDVFPDGFANPTGPAGEPVGGVIAFEVAGQKGGGDTKVLTEKISQLTKMVAHLQRSNAASGGSRPWNERQEDGSVNPASYAVSQVRHTRATVSSLIAQAIVEGEVEVSSEQIRAWESSLTRVLLWLADRVMQQVTGGVDRMSKAHTEAGAWVAHVINVEDRYTAAMLGDDDASKQAANGWAKRVRDAAADRYREALELTAEFINQDVAPAPADQPTQAQAQAMFADDQEARQMWDELIMAVGMENHIGDLNPILTATFGTFQSTQIPAARMREALSEWAANPAAFKEQAATEWSKVNAPAA